jgi:hypothetical protein
LVQGGYANEHRNFAIRKGPDGGYKLATATITKGIDAMGVDALYFVGHTPGAAQRLASAVARDQLPGYPGNGGYSLQRDLPHERKDIDVAWTEPLAERDDNTGPRVQLVALRPGDQDFQGIRFTWFPRLGVWELSGGDFMFHRLYGQEKQHEAILQRLDADVFHSNYTVVAPDWMSAPDYYSPESAVTELQAALELPSELRTPREALIAASIASGEDIGHSVPPSLAAILTHGDLVAFAAVLATGSHDPWDLACAARAAHSPRCMVAALLRFEDGEPAASSASGQHGSEHATRVTRMCALLRTAVADDDVPSVRALQAHMTAYNYDAELRHCLGEDEAWAVAQKGGRDMFSLLWESRR